jgi:phosphotransferase system HPr-like phosphotransfer protein
MILDSVTAVKEFANVTYQADSDVKLICGKRHIDGKSIMGIFSLDLSQAIELEMDDADAERLHDRLKAFIVDERR